MRQYTQTLINKYNIFCVSETKTDKTDIITLQGYKYMSQSRKQPFSRKSGGIGIFIQNDMFPFVSVIDSDSDYILWVKVTNRYLERMRMLF